ncbi:imidazoleglycerol-phosphate dehydratase HisB [Desulfocurvus sp.]|jgi:imidazoleglycerol-phosphate dehydratase|uniref:imidazoleglycerol-phosphate dehydratase HisB n=1 Tax=Desulfocurvus sp. TaxID=2871698 RepID=UPI0025C03589|nr:imidazoleglycerol-phosphate dehydratase HisB [Desulfocurvus sp.]MCK9239548.1 imidazoleglycerol-phosphate dehydratase HisB [Desulfocurvus sp.]
MNTRSARYERATKETRVEVALNLDGSGKAEIATGVGFADHMLTLLAFWARMDLTLTCRGDLEVDAHHTLEDVGLCLGQVLAEALGDKRGIARIGLARVPMDEALTEVVVDISGRPYLVYEDGPVPAIIAGDEKDVWREFFKSVAQRAGLNLHINFLYGRNGHHLLESAFKGFGLALGQAVARTREGVTSTKGSLD